MIFLFIALAAILCIETAALAICTTRDDTDHSCDVSLKSPSGLEMKRKYDYYIYSSAGRFEQRIKTCRRYAQLEIILITSVKFH
jgi:hypothetical protein